MECIIEKMELLENPMDHDHVSRILSREHTALAAIGSPACIRTLWFRAKRIGALNRFYGKVLSEIDYALGRQTDELKQIIHEIRRDPSIRHIVVYASCLELVTMCDLEQECRKFEGICVRERSAGGAFLSREYGKDPAQKGFDFCECGKGSAQEESDFYECGKDSVQESFDFCECGKDSAQEGFDFCECGKNTAQERQVSLHVFYRGPLVKRSGSAKQALDEILADIERCEAACVHATALTADSECPLYELEQHREVLCEEKKAIRKAAEETYSIDSLNAEKCKVSAASEKEQNICKYSAVRQENQPVPPFPDFAKRMLEHAWEDCDILLLTPGGCRSCIEETALAELAEIHASTDQKRTGEIRASFYNTRMDDVTIGQGCSELYRVILKAFPKKRPLYLVGSAVLHMIGFDGKALAEHLSAAGRETVWLGGEGF